ncbi:MAG: hypothetical protein DRJ10_12650 [Bacteroidetes bacterium]|nr:MAG: hypothetical protein DRJ10_12650 [Bacteroidota bacterium]
MKHLFTLLFVVLVYNVSIAQPTKAGKLLQEGKLEAAIEAYKTQYSKTPKNWKNTYDLACAYALTFQIDSAYHYLNNALKNDNSLWALADADLHALIDDPRWSDIEINQIKRYQKKNKNLKQAEYAKKLLRLIMKDQALDYYIDQAKGYYMKNGNAPQWYYPIGAFKQKIASENYSSMQKLIEEYGWPKYSTVGKLAADAPLLVINHHESDSVRIKYLPQIKQSCLEKEGSCMEFAKIQDRILVNANKAQIYGMQFRYNAERKLEPFPIIDSKYVDQRRAEIGLEPLKLYLKRKINYNWLIEQKIK